MKLTPLQLLFACFVVSIALPGCQKDGDINDKSTSGDDPHFTLLPSDSTNITFQNQLTEGLNTNILMYEYFYNGGGVATGDFNGDGLIDIYFTANMSDNKMYINKGNMKFEDITDISGAKGREGPWKTGVTLTDVNGDHKLDLYVCYSGALPDEKRTNQLFINQGNDENNRPQFKDEAAAYGLASQAYSNQAYFFDYDRDGDLDAILLNHNPKSLPVLNEVSTAEFLKKDDEHRGVRIYNQQNGKFEDVTEMSGISGSALSYGLGVGITDVNRDGWPDFYISNDYAVPDYLYINNHNGTFTNKLQDFLGHNSQFSMGNDIADINNDGWQDIITLDMLPEDNHRQKLLLAPDNYAKFDLNLRSGFYYQYMRNMLQLNNGDGTFSEIGQFAGISNTDWSWAALLADYDNDGWKDLYVTNGYYRDYTNLDFINYMDDFVKAKGRLVREDVLDIISFMPASNVTNYMYANQEGISFSNVTTQWGMNKASNSNGAAYADLDNDGDLDMVVNNINLPAFIFRNEAQDIIENHYLQVKLVGEEKNTLGLGARVTIYSLGKKQTLEQISSRGYLSAVSPVLHFGIGNVDIIDSLEVIWNKGKRQLLTDVSINQVITLQEENALNYQHPGEQNLATIFEETKALINYEHPDQNVRDFDRQPLLTNELSYTGPCLVKGDLNKDGLEDIFVGGSAGNNASIFVQQKNRQFKQLAIPAFQVDKESHDVDAVIFDANGDGNADIYVASGGYHQYKVSDPLLQDRLYLGDGNLGFTCERNALPEMFSSKGCIAIGDVNQDGYPDLFVGGKVIPGRYPEIPESYLLINDGNGHFRDETESYSPELKSLGLITDAIFTDLNDDQNPDLIVVGEWLPVTIFINNKNSLENKTLDFFHKPYQGWWNTIEVTDFNNDGVSDLMLGNMGTNTQFSVSDDAPAEMYFKDFDNNGSVDPFFCFYIQGKSYPYVTRDELLRQLSSLRSRFTTYKSYADVTIEDIFGNEQLQTAGHLMANHMKTSFFLGVRGGKFKEISLPTQLQYAPVYTFTVVDYNHDGHNDVIACGNNSHHKLRLGKSDANYGILLKGDGKGGFEYIKQSQSGLQLKGDIRKVVQLDNYFIFGVEDGQPITYKLEHLN